MRISSQTVLTVNLGMKLDREIISMTLEAKNDEKIPYWGKTRVGAGNGTSKGYNSSRNESIATIIVPKDAQEPVEFRYRAFFQFWMEID